MNRRVSAFVICIIIGSSSFSLFAKGEVKSTTASTVFNILLSIDHVSSNSPEGISYQVDYQELLNNLKNKQSKWKDDKRFLQHLFYKVHHTYLKEYKPLKSFDKLLENGTYGCLTGTIMYALFLEDLGIEYEIIESNYHIVLIATSAQKRYLFESTDPLNGFISTEKEINTYLETLKNTNTPKQQKNKYYLACRIHNKVTLTNLIGLQYYNMATVAYNHQEYPLAAYYLNKAKLYYKSPRLEELSQLMDHDLQAQFISSVE